MNTLMTLATSVAVLLHMLLGCCAHHAGGADGHRCVHEEATHCCLVSLHCDDAAADSGSGCEHSAPESHLPSPGCDGPQCVFSDSVVKVSVPDTPFDLPLVVDVGNFCVSAPANATFYAWEAPPPRPPLRPHALFQVFLI